MPIVAVAGGTGDVGQTIVDELLRVAKFKIVVLTRENPEVNPVQQLWLIYSHHQSRRKGKLKMALCQPQ